MSYQQDWAKLKLCYAFCVCCVALAGWSLVLISTQDESDTPFYHVYHVMSAIYRQWLTVGGA